jgi:uncharacterized damage-inducible protein DinB
MARFTGTGYEVTPALATELYSDFASLREARSAEDARIEAFLSSAGEDLLSKEIHYVNNMGVPCSDPVSLLLAHLFNHQTHHRGQIHVMLSQTAIKPPSLDMHRVIRPVAARA